MAGTGDEKSSGDGFGFELQELHHDETVDASAAPAVSVVVSGGGGGGGASYVMPR